MRAGEVPPVRQCGAIARRGRRECGTYVTKVYDVDAVSPLTVHASLPAAAEHLSDSDVSGMTRYTSTALMVTAVPPLLAGSEVDSCRRPPVARKRVGDGGAAATPSSPSSVMVTVMLTSRPPSMGTTYGDTLTMDARNHSSVNSKVASLISVMATVALV